MFSNSRSDTLTYWVMLALRHVYTRYRIRTTDTHIFRSIAVRSENAEWIGNAHDGEINVDASISPSWIEICLWMPYICCMRDGKIDA